MGKRGPKKTPTAILAARGSRTVEKRKREPKAPAILPSPPAWLGADGKKLWRALAPKLTDSGIATDLDTTSFGLLCTACDHFHAARRIVEKEGLMATSDKGSVYQNPAVGMRNQAFKQLSEMLCQFGLTPASRPGVEAVAGGHVDDLDVFAASKPSLKVAAER